MLGLHVISSFVLVTQQNGTCVVFEFGVLLDLFFLFNTSINCQIYSLLNTDLLINRCPSTAFSYH